jgi:hypothetical protein
MVPTYASVYGRMCSPTARHTSPRTLVAVMQIWWACLKEAAHSHATHQQNTSQQQQPRRVSLQQQGPRPASHANTPPGNCAPRTPTTPSDPSSAAGGSGEGTQRTATRWLPHVESTAHAGGTVTHTDAHTRKYTEAKQLKQTATTEQTAGKASPSTKQHLNRQHPAWRNEQQPTSQSG